MESACGEYEKWMSTERCASGAAARQFRGLGAAPAVRELALFHQHHLHRAWAHTARRAPVVIDGQRSELHPKAEDARRTGPSGEGPARKRCSSSPAQRRAAMAVTASQLAFSVFIILAYAARRST